MRKENNKIPKTEPRMQSHAGLTSRRYQHSLHEIVKVPIFTAPDDEEYFFEVEDF